MLISDWISDVCSSDLAWRGAVLQFFQARLDFACLRGQLVRVGKRRDQGRLSLLPVGHHDPLHAGLLHRRGLIGKIGGGIAPLPTGKLLQEIDKAARAARSEEHTSELQSLMRISYAVFCLKKKNKIQHRIQAQETN